ncbi:hypothetical protein SS50377_24292 [Spironucleus salmonicida]|uniref:Uncharacterized protein n=1 Tax=Spironucleus salmonicida TaxID=348837 RepID=V6LJW8_9EUKA|nr:hypothetical protein SS50377_24292 [Spironucleus salmonicida]|eukprot:EST44832.1 Hypothetical protein SS50377_15278 [Spironucleus salmonicida]
MRYSLHRQYLGLCKPQNWSNSIFITPYQMIDFEFQAKTPNPATYQVQVKKFTQKVPYVIQTQKKAQIRPKIKIHIPAPPLQIAQVSPFHIDEEQLLARWRTLLSKVETLQRTLAQVTSTIAAFFTGPQVLHIARFQLRRDFCNVLDAKTALQNDWYSVEYGSLSDMTTLCLRGSGVFVEFYGARRIILAIFELTLFDFEWNSGGQEWVKKDHQQVRFEQDELQDLQNKEKLRFQVQNLK